MTPTPRTPATTGTEVRTELAAALHTGLASEPPIRNVALGVLRELVAAGTPDRAMEPRDDDPPVVLARLIAWAVRRASDEAIEAASHGLRSEPRVVWRALVTSAA